MIRQNERDRKSDEYSKTFREFETDDLLNYPNDSFFRKLRDEYMYHDLNEFQMMDLCKYAKMPSSSSTEYLYYIEHRLTTFNEAIATYTTKKYSRLQLDKHIWTQKSMDKITNMLTSCSNGEPILLCIGGAEFNASSPIKKYRRCPGVRKLVVYLKKKSNCDIVFVDEYNTSQSCGTCHEKYAKNSEDEAKYKRWSRLGYRYRTCMNCEPMRRHIIIPPAKVIQTPKPQRRIETEKNELANSTNTSNKTSFADNIQ